MSPRVQILLIAGAAVGLAGGLWLGGDGDRGPRAAGHAVRAAPVGHADDGGVAVDLPPGWQRLDPPITSVVYPTERLLLTSYPAARGGDCSPDRAEGQLPVRGALVYLFEYSARPGTIWNAFRRSDFPPRPAHFTLPASARGAYECWYVPSFLLRFSAAGRDFQMHVALGPGIGRAGRRQVLAVLDSLRFRRRPGAATPSSRATPARRSARVASARAARATPARRSGRVPSARAARATPARRSGRVPSARAAPGTPSRPFTAGQLEAALRMNPNREAKLAECSPATAADRREARHVFGGGRSPLFVCRLEVGGEPAATYDVAVMGAGCFVGERRRPGRADYGCIRGP